MRTIATLALLLSLTSAYAQRIDITEPDTPKPLTTFMQQFGGDGSVYTLTAIGGKATYFNLPFSLDFSGGVNVLVGKRTPKMGSLLDEVPAYGLEAYGLKYIGGDGAYVRIGVRFLMDGDNPDGTRGPQRGRITGTLAIGWVMD